MNPYKVKPTRPDYYECNYNGETVWRVRYWDGKRWYFDKGAHRSTFGMKSADLWRERQ